MAQSAPKPHDGLWTPQVLAAFLGVPVKTLYSWRYLGTGPPFIRVGRHLRYRRADVETWLAEQTDIPRGVA